MYVFFKLMDSSGEKNNNNYGFTNIKAFRSHLPTELANEKFLYTSAIISSSLYVHEGFFFFLEKQLFKGSY